MMTIYQAQNTLDDLETLCSNLGNMALMGHVQNLKDFIADQQEQYQNLRDGVGRLFADLAQNIGENK